MATLPLSCHWQKVVASSREQASACFRQREASGPDLEQLRWLAATRVNQPAPRDSVQLGRGRRVGLAGEQPMAVDDGDREVDELAIVDA
jgi:hypothetical protein